MIAQNDGSEIVGRVYVKIYEGDQPSSIQYICKVGFEIDAWVTDVSDSKHPTFKVLKFE